MPPSPTSRIDSLHSLLATRIAVLDGAMGTMVHALGLDEQGFRGVPFRDHPKDLKNCIDVLTQVAAATKALQGVALGLVSDHLHHCVAEAASDPDALDTKLDEASKAITRLVRS